MELGSMMHTMVWTYLTWINQDVGTTAKMANINLPARLSSTLMESPRKSAFIECLKASKYLLPSLLHGPPDPYADCTLAGPCLVQVSYPDVFWNGGDVDYDLIAKAFKALDNYGPGQYASGSWTSVMMMLLRKDGDTSNTYSTNKSLASLTKYALDRINQCAKEAVVLVTGKFKPDPTQNHEPGVLEGIKSAGNFLWKKIEGSGGVNSSKGLAPTSSDGLGFLLKRMHEMLLGLALVFESHTIMEKEKEYGFKAGITAADLKRLSKELSGDAIFSKGPVGADRKVWQNARREAYASLAVFALFGVAGWFTIMSNWRRYSMADIYGLMTLAEQKVSLLMTAEDNTLDTSHPLSSAAWKYLNGLIIHLIHSCKLTSPNPNWYTMQQLWADALEPSVISELLLVYIYNEIPFPKPSVSRFGQATHQ